MNRRVQVRAAMFARGVSGGRVPISTRGSPPGFLLPLKRFRGRPVNGLLVETVGQVNDLRFIDGAALLVGRPSGAFSHAFFRSVRSPIEGEERDSADEQGCDNRQNQFVHILLLIVTLAQRRTRKQAVDPATNRLLTRVALRRYRYDLATPRYISASNRGVFGKMNRS